IRLGATQSAWTITAAPSASLALEGLFISGGDLVLRGDFDQITITCCTLDPGTGASVPVGGHPLSPPSSALYADAVDGRALVPTRIWIEGSVKQLTADRCVLGPIRTRAGGTVATITISNSVVQAIATGEGLLDAAQVKDPDRLAARLNAAADPVSADIVK